MTSWASPFRTSGQRHGERGMDMPPIAREGFEVVTVEEAPGTAPPHQLHDDE